MSNLSVSQKVSVKRIVDHAAVIEDKTTHFRPQIFQRKLTVTDVGDDYVQGTADGISNPADKGIAVAFARAAFSEELSVDTDEGEEGPVFIWTRVGATSEHPGQADYFERA